MTVLLVILTVIMTIAISVWNVAKPIIIANNHRRNNGGEITWKDTLLYCDAFILCVMHIIKIVSGF